MIFKPGVNHSSLKKCGFLVSTCVSFYSQQAYHLAVVFSMALCVHSSHVREEVFWYENKAFLLKVEEI